MSYEMFRNDVIQNLSVVLPKEQMDDALSAVDTASANYDIQRKPVSLMVVNGIPEEVKAYIVARSIKGCTQGTLRNYLSVLSSFFTQTNKRVNEITVTDVRAWIGWYKLNNRISDNTMNQKRIIVNGFFEWCFNEGLIDRNPCKTVDPIKFNVKHRDPVDIIDLEKMRFCCKDIREKAILDLLYSSGLRVSELCNLKIEDIDWKDHAIHVMHGKGDKYRMTYINAESIISLQAYLSTRQDDCPYVFTNVKGKERHKVGKGSIERIIRSIGERAGVQKKVIPHRLRNTFATTLSRNGCPIEQIQQMMGHSKIETTLIYTKINQAEVKRNHERCAI